MLHVARVANQRGQKRERGLKADIPAVEICFTSLPGVGRGAVCSVVGHVAGALAVVGWGQALHQHQLLFCPYIIALQ